MIINTPEKDIYTNTVISNLLIEVKNLSEKVKIQDTQIAVLKEQLEEYKNQNKLQAEKLIDQCEQYTDEKTSFVLDNVIKKIDERRSKFLGFF